MIIKRVCNLIFAALCAAILSSLTVSAAEESAPATPPDSGFFDPEAIPARPPMVDIEPVYRGPSVDTLATIRKRGTLLVGVALSDPMVMHDANGELIGYSVDLARQLADDLGVDLEFVPTSWSQIIPDLLDRRFDVIVAGLWATPGRALLVNYSEATATEGVHLVANSKLAAGMTTEQDFNRPDVRIAAYAGSVQERLVKTHFPQATLVRVEGDDLQMTPVLEGRAHAALVPTFAPQLVVRLAPDTLTLPLAQPLSATFTAMGVRKGDPDFLNYLNTWLAFHKAEGWLAERIHHWSTTTSWLE